MPLFLEPPPAVDTTPELAWVVSRSCRAELTPHPPGNPEVCLGLARRLEVSPRVAFRLGAARCRRELGEAVGAALHEDYLTSIAVESSLLAAQERVRQCAERHGIALVWVKFAALRSAAFVAAGSRVAADIDLLVSERDALRLWQALRREAALSPYGARPHEHQLAALSDSAGAVVEIHTKLPGVMAPDGRFLRLEQMPLSSFDGLARQLPPPPMMAAHALAHGLLQNASSPQAYSPLRMLGDLLDIRRRHSRAIVDAAAYLAPSFASQATPQAEALCVRLASDDPLSTILDESLLLRHCIAARTNDGYAAQLRRHSWSSGPTEAPAWRSRLANLGRLLLPTSLELDAIHGRPSAGIVEASWRRLVRPARLVLKAVRASRRFV